MATYPIKMLKDEENKPFVPLVSTDCIRDENNQTLQQVLDKKLSPTNLLAGDYVSITPEGNNCYINVDLPANLDIINNLTTTSAGQGALDAYQGKVLKDSIPQVVNDLSSTSTTSALSANQGYILNQKFNDYTLTSALEDLIKQYILASHPVGSIEINISGANPSSYLGGTWIAWGTGKVPVGIDIGDDDFKTVEKTGGEKTHKLTVNEMPSHNHQYEDITGNRSLNGQFGRSGYYESETYMGVTNSVIAYADADFRMTYVGGSESHNNLQPYITCYVWIRIT